MSKTAILLAGALLLTFSTGAFAIEDRIVTSFIKQTDNVTQSDYNQAILLAKSLCVRLEGEVGGKFDSLDVINLSNPVNNLQIQARCIFK